MEDISSYLDVGDTASVSEVNSAVEQKNQLMDKELDQGETVTLYVVTWVEHDNVYNEGNAHSTLQQIGVQPEHFYLNVRSEQID